MAQVPIMRQTRTSSGGDPYERRVRTLVDRGDLPEGVLSKSRRYWDPEVIKAFRDDQPQQDADDDVNM